MSGLNQQFAKLRGAERCPEGSNPSLTASLFPSSTAVVALDC